MRVSSIIAFTFRTNFSRAFLVFSYKIRGEGYHYFYILNNLLSPDTPNPDTPNSDFPNLDLPNSDTPNLDIPIPDIPNPDLQNPGLPIPDPQNSCPITIRL